MEWQIFKTKESRYNKKFKYVYTVSRTCKYVVFISDYKNVRVLERRMNEINEVWSAYAPKRKLKNEEMNDLFN